MISYWLKCRTNTESKNPKVGKTKNGRTMLLLKCARCDSSKLKFIKLQEAKGSLSKLTGVKWIILRNLPIANILF